MGLAKYYEDIQKLRDHAACFRDDRIYEPVTVSSSVTAIEALHQAQDKLARWSDSLIAKLDDILEQATDPEINRQILIESQNSEIVALSAKVDSLTENLLKSQKQIEEFIIKLRKLQSDSDKFKKSENEIKEILSITTIERDKCRQRLSEYEKEIAKRQQRRKEDGDFRNLMARDGTKPTRRG